MPEPSSGQGRGRGLGRDQGRMYLWPEWRSGLEQVGPEAGSQGRDCTETLEGSGQVLGRVSAGSEQGRGRGLTWIKQRVGRGLRLNQARDFICAWVRAWTRSEPQSGLGQGWDPKPEVREGMGLVACKCRSGQGRAGN